jgi:hypothetical protein
VKTPAQERFQPDECSYSRRNVCPVCLCSYSDGWEGKYAGGQCGDLSKNQKENCVGRLIPEDDFARAEWILPRECDGVDPRRGIRED